MQILDRCERHQFFCTQLLPRPTRDHAFASNSSKMKKNLYLKLPHKPHPLCVFKRSVKSGSRIQNHFIRDDLHVGRPRCEARKFKCVYIPHKAQSSLQSHRHTDICEKPASLSCVHYLTWTTRIIIAVYARYM